MLFYVNENAIVALLASFDQTRRFFTTCIECLMLSVFLIQFLRVDDQAALSVMGLLTHEGMPCFDRDTLFVTIVVL